MKCIICGKEIEKSCFSHAVICSSECFHVDFWNRTLDDKAIIVDGTCFHDGGNKPNPTRYCSDGKRRKDNAILY